MHVTHLSLADFRSYPAVEVPLGPGTTAFVGANGQGKTNLVEAVSYLATLASHRVATDAPLVRAGAERAVVRAAVACGGRSTLVELEITPGRANRARLNRAPVPRPRAVLGVLRAVLFAPEDLALVKGEPQGRRRFLDDLLVQLAPRLAGVQADYERVLRQRGALLRQATGGRARRRPSQDDLTLPTLDVWDAQLVRAGAELLHARRHLVARLAPHVATAYGQVSGGAAAAVLGYRSSVPLADTAATAEPADVPGRAELAAAVTAELAARRAEELERGVCLVGPHRDDLLLDLGGLPARGYASHGESWSIALALRLGSYHLLRGDTSGPGAGGPAARSGEPAAGGDGDPVLLLDDVFAELDTGRRSRLAALVSDAEQVLLTAAVDDDVPAELAGVRMRVADGQVGRA